MKNKQETINQEIPKNYCIMRIHTKDEEIVGIGITKVKNNHIIMGYVVDTMFEGLRTTIPTVLNFIGNDTIYHFNEDEEVEALKRKCEEIQIPITMKY